MIMIRLRIIVKILENNVFFKIKSILEMLNISREKRIK